MGPCFSARHKNLTKNSVCLEVTTAHRNKLHSTFTNINVRGKRELKFRNRSVTKIRNEKPNSEHALSNCLFVCGPYHHSTMLICIQTLATEIAVN